jgi:signal transduction histidine kinase
MTLAGQIVIVAAGLLAAASSAGAQVAPIPGFVSRPLEEVREVRFLMKQSSTPPRDNEAWEPITLPDDWSVSRPGAKGVGWYRLEIDLEQVYDAPYAFYLPRFASASLSVTANGVFFGNVWPAHLYHRSYGTVFTRPWTIPSAMLKRGRNVIYVRVLADASYHEGLTRGYFGGGIEAFQAVSSRNQWQGGVHRVAGYCALVLGGVAFLAGFRKRKDPVLGWLGLSALAAGLGSLLFDLAGVGPTAWPVGGWLGPTLACAFAAPLLLLLVRIDRLPRRLAVGLAALAIAGVVLPLVPGVGGWQTIAPYAGLLFASALVACATWWGLRSEDESPPVRWMVFGAALLCAATLIHDLGIWFHYADFDSLAAAPIVPLSLAVVTGATLLLRYFAAYRSLQQANAMLEQRVADRTRQLEENFTRLRQLERAKSASEERERLMADLHDGLGGTLVRLLSMVRRGRPDRSMLESELDRALIELQLSLDAMEDFDLDLLVLLGSVRHRLAKLFEAAGIEIDWNVEPLPRTAWLTPERSHHLQRLLLEVFTNAIRHSKARRIGVSVLRIFDDRIRLRIEDDGSGFFGEHSSGGHGLANIRRRSEALGAALVIDSTPGRGTIVDIDLPKAVLEGAIADAPPGSASPSADDETTGTRPAGGNAALPKPVAELDQHGESAVPVRASSTS